MHLWLVGTEKDSSHMCCGNSKCHPRQLLGSALLERVRRRVTCHFLLILSPPGKRQTDMHAYLHAHNRHECIAVLHINIDVHTQAYSCSHEKLCFLSMAGILPGAVDAAAHSVEFLLNNILGGGQKVKVILEGLPSSRPAWDT